MASNRIESTATRLRVVDEAGRLIEVLWTEVTEASVYAIDAVAYVLRCLDLTLANGTAVTITDRDEGWDDALHAIPDSLDLHGVDLAAKVAALTQDGEVQSFTVGHSGASGASSAAVPARRREMEVRGMRDGELGEETRP